MLNGKQTGPHSQFSPCLRRKPARMQRLAVDSLDVFKARAAEKNIELIADVAEDLPTSLLGDPTRLKQVMLNFISNALKFTDSGEIVLRISYGDRTQNLVKVAVIDTGAGIAEGEQAGLFEAFVQASTSTARTHGGTGILQRLGQSPEIVADGAEAVQHFRSGARYDLVLMDCEMPKLNGVDATREIRSFEKERHRTSTPVVALSAHAFKAKWKPAAQPA